MPLDRAIRISDFQRDKTANETARYLNDRFRTGVHLVRGDTESCIVYADELGSNDRIRSRNPVLSADWFEETVKRYKVQFQTI